MNTTKENETIDKVVKRMFEKKFEEIKKTPGLNVKQQKSMDSIKSAFETFYSNGWVDGAEDMKLALVKVIEENGFSVDENVGH